MAEEHDHSRKDAGKAAWLKIFTGFKLALDPKKLLLAGAGIFVTYLGWWVLSWIFYSLSAVPEASGYTEIKSAKDTDEQEKADRARKLDAYLDSCLRWTLLHELAGSPVDWEIIKKWVEEILKETNETRREKMTRLVKALGQHGGLLRASPWDEYRGPNQFMVVSRMLSQAGTDQLEVLTPHQTKGYLQFMVEPLYKFLLPVTSFFDARAGWLFSKTRIYLVFVMLWMIAVWGFFGGAITRMATVQLARNEKVSLREALQFVCARWQGYVFAPVLPLAFLAILSVVLLVLGFFFGVTFVLGDVLGGLLWPLAILLGLIMAVIMVGLVGWPLMNATISTEGSDSFDALSRSYSYVYQVPWHCLGYSALAVAYGAVLVFFVGFMGSLIVYLGGWGINQGNFGIESRDPAFLFVHAPSSFEWRELLIKDSPHAVLDKQHHYVIPEEVIEKTSWYEHSSLGTYLVTFWLGLFFLLVIGFGYSYFWCAASTIYLLLRQKVDDTDLDEVYLEEDEDKPIMPETPSTPPSASAPAAASSAPPAVTFTMVDSPAIRSGPPPATQLAPPQATQLAPPDSDGGPKAEPASSNSPPPPTT